MPDEKAKKTVENTLPYSIAVIGFSCRFPGANNIDKFWANLKNGVESITMFTKEELLRFGIGLDELSNPNYVRSKGIVDDVEMFDYQFFGYSLNEAKRTDPQQRIFLECAWEALEFAGYAPIKYDGLVSVFAGMADSTYLHHNLLQNKVLLSSTDWFQLRIATSMATLATQASYRLNLKGASINLNTACSTSLVAVAQACRSLIDYECDMAVAGAVAIDLPQQSGYLFEEGGIVSSDGHCRAFDVAANGTVFSNGGGVVILKRLEDAVNDGDTVHALIRGYGLNNDGADKVGYSAVSVNGQASCIISALASADISADTIGYVEAHGTGTALGDAVEVMALTDAFRKSTNRKNYCALGSVKTNIGHTDIAAGMAALIKTILTIKHGYIPPLLHYHSPNPNIDFSNSPFYINKKLQKWETDGVPRRAAVSAFGIGGTNAHIVLEQSSNDTKNYSSTEGYHLICLSAKTKLALEQQKNNFFDFIRGMEEPCESIADIAYTLLVGRAEFDYRWSVVFSNDEKKQKIIEMDNRYNSFYKKPDEMHPRVVFLFGGQGTEYVGMASKLYEKEPVFANFIDECISLLGVSFGKIIYAVLKHTEQEDIFQLIHETRIAQIVLFVIEYSLASFFIYLGIVPSAMIGHGLGEYVAACLSGVMNLETGLHCILHRSALMGTTNKEAMLTVFLDEGAVNRFLNNDVVIAVINSPKCVVLSGTLRAIDELEVIFLKENVSFQRLSTVHGFHAELMDDILVQFRNVFDSVALASPKIPFISNVTGGWITKEQATNPDYWVSHFRQPIKFSQGVSTLLSEEFFSYLEVSPSKLLAQFIGDIASSTSISIIQSLLDKNEKGDDQYKFLGSLRELWFKGFQINWHKYYDRKKRKRVNLPTYPFQKKRCWINPDTDKNSLERIERLPFEQWFYEPSWKRESLPLSKNNDLKMECEQFFWVIISDDHKIGDVIYSVINKFTDNLLLVENNETFLFHESGKGLMNLNDKAHYEDLFRLLHCKTNMPLKIIHTAGFTKWHDSIVLDFQEIERVKNNCFYSLLFLVQAYLTEYGNEKLAIFVVANELFSVLGNEKVFPAKSLVIGPCQVIPQEHPSIEIKLMDIFSESVDATLAMDILRECQGENKSLINIFAFRNQYRWCRTYVPLKLQPKQDPLLRHQGVYLITGGLGGIGLTLAKCIAQQVKSTLILISRAGFISKTTWDEHLAHHGVTESTSVKINLLKEIELLGSKVVILSGDVSAHLQMQEVVNQVKQTYGVIHGVIHAAGIAGGGVVELKTPEVANKVFESKVEATYLLAYLLREEPMDFFISCSSVSSIIGEIGQVDYCSANACLDAFPFYPVFKPSVYVSTINWNTWRDLGMAVETPRPKALQLFDRNNDISPEEGLHIFSQVLRQNYAQYIISCSDINSFIALTNENKNVPITYYDETHERSQIELKSNYHPPCNILEMKIEKIWENLLGIKGIGIHDDFFELGGHSLLALRLMTNIDEKLQVKLPLQLIYSASTIAKLAAEIELNSQNFNHRHLVIFKEQGNSPPIFLIHPVGGAIFCFDELIKKINVDVPIYALQDVDFSLDNCKYENIEKMASAYLKLIQEKQPQGPYCFIGYSFGATIAAEMSHQLKNSEKRNLLILLDGWAVFSKFQHDQFLFKKTMQERITLNVPDMHEFIERAWHRMQLMLSYNMPLLTDKVVLLKAETLLPEYSTINEPNNGWSGYADDLRVYSVPGDHESMMQEANVNIVAKFLNELIASERTLS